MTIIAVERFVKTTGRFDIENVDSTGIGVVAIDGNIRAFTLYTFIDGFVVEVVA